MLGEIYFPGGLDADTDGPGTLPLTTRVLLDQLDPRNVTLGPEYYHETDLERYYTVLLDDRGGIRIGDRASVSDFVNVYSRSHHIRDARAVRTPRTVIGDGVRIAYHATVLAGATLAPDSMVGAGALVTRDTEPGTVHVGVPARPAARKPVGERRPPTRDPLAEE